MAATAQTAASGKAAGVGEGVDTAEVQRPYEELLQVERSILKETSC